MKAIQVSFDERLLVRLDADPEVKKVGRSEVMRRAVSQYLKQRSAARIQDAYQQAYGASRSGLGEEFDGWTDEGSWPAK